MLSFRDGAVERWSGGAVERWSGGAVERWSGGAVERWSGGAVKRWRHGAMGIQIGESLQVIAPIAGPTASQGGYLVAPCGKTLGPPGVGGAEGARKHSPVLGWGPQKRVDPEAEEAREKPVSHQSPPSSVLMSSVLDDSAVLSPFLLALRDLLCWSPFAMFCARLT